jgi:hypothetical protein
MSMEIRIPESASEKPSFGTTSLRLLPPQDFFELVRTYAAWTARRALTGNQTAAVPPAGSTADAGDHPRRAA